MTSNFSSNEVVKEGWAITPIIGVLFGVSTPVKAMISSTSLTCVTPSLVHVMRSLACPIPAKARKYISTDAENVATSVTFFFAYF